MVRAAGVLMCLSKGHNTVTEIAKECNFSVSTAHRLLQTLTQPLFVTYDSVNHRYYLGPLVNQIASNVRSTHQYLLMFALDEMKRLSGLSEETITLAVVVGTQYVHLYDIPSVHGLNVNADLKATPALLPLGAEHKVLLSQLSDRELGLVLKSTAVWNARHGYVIDIQSLKSLLMQIRKDGYSVTVNERIPGAMGISAPVKNYLYPTALTILGPESRLAQNAAKLIPELKLSVKRLSADMARFRKELTG